MTVDLMIELDRALDRVHELACALRIEIGWRIVCSHVESKPLRYVEICKECREDRTERTAELF